VVLYAKDIVETDFLTMPGSTTVFDAAHRMRDAKHGYAVVGTRDQPQGLVTEWDILAKVVAEGRSPKAVKVGEIMSAPLVSVKGEDGIVAVANMMSERGVRRVLVTQGDQVVGVITSKTVLRRLNEYMDKVTAQISRLQAPWF
jgi:malate dehydrogenase (oxaloacetate-decarboxylating)